MAPKQVTLGKFFGKISGPRAQPLQTTLAFSRPKTDTAAFGDNGSLEVKREEVGSPSESKSEDTVMSDAHDDSKSSLPPETPKSPKNRKRDVKKESDEDDEEPVTKRRRRTVKAVSDKASDEDVDIKKEEPNPPEQTNATASPQTPTTKKSKKVVEEDQDEKKSTPRRCNVQVVIEVAREKTTLESESDEKSPAPKTKAKAATKARKKAKAKKEVKAKVPDPYPDWEPGEPVPYAALCETFSLVEMTTKRLEILELCANFLRQVLRLTPQDLLPTIQLMINKLAADYTGIELGIGESLIMKAIGESTGRSLQVIKADQHEIGDLGLVAAKSRSNQPTMFKPKPLTVRGVHEGLMAIATVQGEGAQTRKVGGIKRLLSAADPATASKGSKSIDITKNKGGASEAKFIIRFLEGKLRLGLAEKTVLVALAHAVVAHEMAGKHRNAKAEHLEKGEVILKQVYSELPSYEVIIPAMLEHGILNLRDNCKLQPGVPLKPMLAKPTKSITEVLDRFEGKTFTCEFKYDGERAQIHYISPDTIDQYPANTITASSAKKGLCAIFSRNSEDLSKKYPDVLGKLHNWIKPDVKSFVLDCETVAWDVEEKKILPFQQLMTRKRKDVKAEDVKVKVCVFAFDLLFFNGKSIVKKTFRERREILHDNFTPCEGEFCFAQFGNTNDIEEIQTLLDDSIKASCEGLMVKMLDTEESGYEPSKRSRNWLKVKKDYLAGIGDSLDLVVLGAYFGQGKRTSVYGAFLLACYNTSTQNYESVCNIGTGFSDALLEQLHEQLSEYVIDKPKPFYSHSASPKDQPNVWFEPKFVWEVRTADLTLSPRYKAASDSTTDGRGISLRFPRFIKQRDDKKPDEATASGQVLEMYERQEVLQKENGPAADDDFEY